MVWVKLTAKDEKMTPFKIVRKIGKMLRGGAGKKEVFLGALMGVLIGFNPVAGLTLALAILITLLLNANIGFTLLGAALGKLLSLLLSVASFHTGYILIHKAGLEGLITRLVNAPITALMDLEVYAMIGSLPFALIIGIVFGKFMSSTVTRIREQMVKAGEHDKIGKAVGSRFSRILIWLAFGKQKISTADVLARTSPLLRKSGLILVCSVLVIGLALEFLLLDIAVRKGIQAGISARTGAEVNIGKAHLSLAGGTLELEALEVTDPEKPSHNLVQIDTLAADLSVSDLLRRSYTIDLLAGSTLKRDIPRKSPGAVYARKDDAKAKAAAAEKAAKKDAPGKSLDDYFAQAKNWKRYGDKAYEYLKKSRDNAEAKAKGEKPKPSKATAVADAKKLGYLKASADLVADRPAWIIREIRIDNVDLGGGYPVQHIRASEVSSHPELNGRATTAVMTPAGGSEPTASITLRFDDPSARHELAAHFTDIALAGAVETSDSFPINISEGRADIKAGGTFSTEALDLPFNLMLHNLKADVEEGRSIMGMDAETAGEVFSSMEQIEIDGSVGGSLLSPRIQIDYDKLSANMKTALVAAGKKELSKRADAEIDKAKDELTEQAGEELGKLLGGGDDDKEGKSTEDQAEGLLKKLF
jgi:uncharacterized protein (TIGR03546 family)